MFLVYGKDVVFKQRETPPLEKNFVMLGGLDAKWCYLWPSFGMVIREGITVNI